MKPAAVRLLLFGKASAYRRLAGIVGGIAVAVGILLLLLGTFMHLPDRDARTSWIERANPALLEVDASGGAQDAPLPTERPGTVLVAQTRDFFGRLAIDVVKTAAKSDTTVAFPGDLAPPGPGEYYASPAMAKRIADTPGDQLGDRYGTMIGELPASTLRGPSQLAVLSGLPWATLAAGRNTHAVDSFDFHIGRANSVVYQAIVALGAIAIVVPVVLLVGIVSQLGAAQRRERFATARLIGAGRSSIALVSGTEMGIASLVGAVLGIAVMAVLRPFATHLHLNQSTSFASDMSPSAAATCVLALGVGVLGAATAWWRTYRDDVGALGVTRGRPEKPVTWGRIWPLALGLALLTIAAVGVNRLPGSFMYFALLAGFALVAFGVLFAGPSLTKATALLLRRTARRAPSIVAAGHLARHPRATFRTVSAIVVAVFLVSVLAGSAAIGGTPTQPHDVPGVINPNAVAAEVGTGVSTAALEAAVMGTQGVTHLAVAYADPGTEPYEITSIMRTDDARAIGMVNLPNSSAVTVYWGDLLLGPAEGALPPPVTAQFPAEAEPNGVVVLTDGDPAATERARTALAASGLPISSAVTRVNIADDSGTGLEDEVGVMAFIMMAIAVSVSALALTVATISAALDRKRSFGLLRLAGMPVGALRRVIVAESAVPLSATLVASAGLGFVVAALFLAASGSGETVHWPDARYFVTLAVSVGIAAIAIVSSFGIVSKSTEIESTRFE